MQIDYFLLAEGIGVDAGGVVTAIGLNRNVFAPPSLPGTTKRALFLHLEEGETPFTAGLQVTVEMRVSSPSGKTISTTSQHLELGEKRFSSLPADLLVPAEVILTVEEYGTHEIEAEVRAGEWSEQAHLSLYVINTEARP